MQENTRIRKGERAQVRTTFSPTCLKTAKNLQSQEENQKCRTPRESKEKERCKKKSIEANAKVKQNGFRT